LFIGAGLLDRLRCNERKRWALFTQQLMQPVFIKQQLLASCFPECADLLDLTPYRKGLKLDPQRNELFEMLSFGITEASLPLRYSAPGNTEVLGQPRLCQADARAQRQHRLTEGIVALTIARGTFHGSSPFLLTHQSNTMKQCEVTRHLIDGDFPRQQRYTGIYQVCAPFGSTPLWGCMGAMSSDPIQSLLSLYDSRFSGGRRASCLRSPGACS